jgi:hypothetical protein
MQPSGNPKIQNKKANEGLSGKEANNNQTLNPAMTMKMLMLNIKELWHIILHSTESSSLRGVKP